MNTSEIGRASEIGRRTFLRGGAALAASATGAGMLLGAAPKPLAQPRTVSVRFNWTMKGEFAPFVVARDQGYYKRLNIEAQLEPGKSGTQAAQVVATGNDPFGYIPSVQLVEAVNHGLPVRAVAACGRYTGMCWASRSNVPLAGPRSLEGHRVSISPSSTFFQVWNAFAKKFNVDQSKVEVVGADPSARMGLFLNRQIDIMADIFLANDYVILEHKANEKLNLFRLAQVDFDPLGYLLIVNTGVLARDPELVHAFTYATLQGFRYTIDHPDDAARMMRAADSGNLGGPVIDGQVHELVTLINARPVLGKNEADAWNRSLDILVGSGVIDKKLDQRQYYTNEFVA